MGRFGGDEHAAGALESRGEEQGAWGGAGGARAWAGPWGGACGHGAGPRDARLGEVDESKAKEPKQKRGRELRADY